MSTIPYDKSQPDWETDDYDAIPPRRPRRQLWNKATGALLAAIACAAAFYAGVRVEKGQASSSSTGSAVGLPTALRSAAGGAGAGARTGFAGASRGGFPAAGAGGGATFGTVASVNGKTIFVTDASGNTVKVRLSSATKVTKSLSVSRHSLRPGDTVVVQGVTGSKGTVSASSVSDSGAGAVRSTAGSSASGSGSGTSGSGSSGSGAVNSLFGKGG